MMQGKSKFEIKARPRLAGTKALCERLGICRSHLYQVTRGLRRPSPRLAARLRRLGVAVPDYAAGKVVAQ
ncbi:MAG: hypothetical protein IJQ73_12850 [Kiritimatiellae bacterium]|nr:hypothetical protein [Kiritimatiellia bacterium]